MNLPSSAASIRQSRGIALLRRLVRLGLPVLLFGATTAVLAGTPLNYCGHHNGRIVMEQVPTDWWNYGNNNNAMATWNQYMDLFRFIPSDGTWGSNGTNEFGGFPSDADLYAQYEFHWGPDWLAVTPTTWGCECCPISESDVLFNPSVRWTSSATAAEDNCGLVHYYTNLIHELGHVWGEQTKDENYDYDLTSVMHAYTPCTVYTEDTIHAADGWLLRRDYDDQFAIPNTIDLGVFSRYASNGLVNTTTNRSKYHLGDAMTITGLSVENIGYQTLSNVHVRIYLSSDRTISTSDAFVADWQFASFPAEVAGTYNLTQTIPFSVADGTYYVGAIVTYNGFTPDLWTPNNTTHLLGKVQIVRPCADDSFEENDSVSTARPIGPGNLANLQICENDDDWFLVSVPALHAVSARMSFSDASGDLDLFLYDWTHTLIDSSTSTTNGESVESGPVSSSTYFFVRVHGFGGAENSYSLEVSLINRDVDRDGILDTADNCPTVANPTQSNADGDAFGDACDECPLDPLNDQDGDGRCANSDNCPDRSNPGQEDFDRDGQGDACDRCTDRDGDGFGDPGFPPNTCREDNCPALANASQSDGDRDGIGDYCDNCPFIDNPGQADSTPGDGIGDACQDPVINANVNNERSSEGRIDGSDLFPLARSFSLCRGADEFDARVDLNRDGCVDGIDLSVLGAVWGRVVGEE